MSKNTHLRDEIYTYLTAHNPPIDQLTQDLIDETASLGSISGMQLGVDQASFLAWMVGLLQARFVVEVGTFTGLSSLFMARALPKDGRILCCDVSDEYTSMARRYWDRAGVADRIELVLAPATETLQSLPESPSVDLAFVDADKGGYVTYYEELVPRLSPRGVIIADNIFMGTRTDGGANAEAIAGFARHVQDDPRTETVVISIGDGFTLTRLAAG